jgi:hypothetical protein
MITNSTSVIASRKNLFHPKRLFSLFCWPAFGSCAVVQLMWLIWRWFIDLLNKDVHNGEIIIVIMHVILWWEEDEQVFCVLLNKITKIVERTARDQLNKFYSLVINISDVVYIYFIHTTQCVTINMSSFGMIRIFGLTTNITRTWNRSTRDTSNNREEQT